MHTNRISPARKIIVWLTAALGLALLSGCETVTLTDLTPKSMAHIFERWLPIDLETQVCPRGHAFDVARSGYVNLLQPQDRRSPGQSHAIFQCCDRLGVPPHQVVRPSYFPMGRHVQRLHLEGGLEPRERLF